MSQIYDKYSKLKAKDSETLYLFRSGNFYIFIGDDAEKINEYVVLKKTSFCKEAMKCGFPIGSLDEYLKVFSNHGLKIQVVENALEKDIDKAIDSIKKIDLNKVTPIKALDILKDIQEML